MVHQEQEKRFESILERLDGAMDTLEEMRALATSQLSSVANDSSEQARCLQQLQQAAGVAVDNLTEAANTARHARSYQAQQHNRNTNE